MGNALHPGKTSRHRLVGGIAILLLGLAASAFAQGVSEGKGQGVEVLSVTPPQIDARAGEIVSLSFRVTSHAPGEEQFVEDLKLPDDWQALVPLSIFALQRGQMAVRVVAVAVPRTTPAGPYKVSYSVRSQRDYAIKDSQTVSINVLPSGKLLLLLDKAPSSVIAGEQWQARVRAVNQGNAALHVVLTALRDDRQPMAVDPPKLDLAAGASGVATVTVRTDATERRPRRQCLVVVAAGTGEGKPQKAAVTIGVDLIPRVTTKMDFHRRIPATLTITGLNEYGSGVQAELAAHGALDEAGTRTIDFLLRAPDLQDRSTYGLRDEFRLSYNTPDLGLQLGDQSYSLSRLTDYLRYGRGLGFDVHRRDEPEFGAFYVHSRWESPGEEEIGAHVGTRLGSKASARLNYLSRQEDGSVNRPEYDDKLWSLSADVQPVRGTSVRLEYARGNSDRETSVSDTAYDIWVEGHLGNAAAGSRAVEYNFSKTHAGPDYYGYYHDADYTNASVSAPLSSRLQAHASMQTWKQNLDIRPVLSGTAPREDVRQLGLSYDLGHGYYATADYDNFETRDVLLPADFDFAEKDLRLALGRSADRYGFRAEVRTGRQDDHLSGGIEHVTRCNLYASYRPGQHEYFTLYGGFGSNNSLGLSRFLSESNNVGASFVWTPRDDLRMRLSYLKYGFSDPERSSNDQLQFDATYHVSNDSAWAFHIRHNAPGGDTESDTAVALSYVFSFGIPVGTRHDVGALSGRVFDADKPGKPGIPDVVLTVGTATAVTDHTGRFSFPALAPGVYQLRVADGAFRFKRAPTVKLPITVHVEAAKTQEVEIPVVDAASIRGQVTLVAEPAGVQQSGQEGAAPYVAGAPGPGGGDASGPSPGGLRDILVEISNGEQTFRGTTDYRGDFRFLGLAPGKWRLKVYDGNLPAYHRLDREQVSFDLKPGQVGKADLHVVPERRHIKMVDDQPSPVPTTVIPPRQPATSLVPEAPAPQKTAASASPTAPIRPISTNVPAG